MRLAIDIGGTFTDLVFLDEHQTRLGLAKVSSTPPNFAHGIIAAIRKSSINPKQVQHFVHGSTIIINALTERQGSKTALVTTRGFRDVLEIGRSNRPDMYNLKYTKQEPFVPRELRFEITERLNYLGEVEKPLLEDDVRQVVEALRGDGVEAIAICFLHSYANTAHEARTAEILRQSLPGVYISESHRITKEWREYERTSTTVLNAYVQSTAALYLVSLEQELSKLGMRASLNIMKSSGGTSSFVVTKEQPIHAVESGPVAGVIGAQALGEAIGAGNLITMDIGGTTAKTSLIEGGKVKITTDYRIERDAWHPGYPIKVPAVDIVEIGAGGGSIAGIDAGGALRVGPRSAGAVPGPACYNQGGTQPTVTDANLVAGRINPDYFLGGEIRLSVERAREAIAPIARHYGMSVEEAALGIIRVANASMVNAIKLVSVRRGHDPRDFAMVAFGGGGPMHAAALAQELRIGRVIIPYAPGHFSAWGMLMTDPRQDFVRTLLVRSTDEGMAVVQAEYEDLEREAAAFFQEAGYDVRTVTAERHADMRYLGQEHTVRVPIPGGRLNRAEVEERFHLLHEQAYTFRLDSKIEFVNFHVTGHVIRPNVDLRGFVPPLGGDGRPKGRRLVRFANHGVVDSPIYERANLPAGAGIDGPAIVEEPAATTVVAPGQRLTVDGLGNLIIETGGGEASHGRNRADPD